MVVVVVGEKRVESTTSKFKRVPSRDHEGRPMSTECAPSEGQRKE